MNEHVVDYQQSGHPAGMIAVLEVHRHARPMPGGWSEDGRTCEPGTPCTAISMTSNELCAKREAVVEIVARTKFARVGSGDHVIPLCGGHFNSHRAGREIRVVVTPARVG